MSKSRVKDKDDLTAADRRFADEYLVDLNITRAAEATLNIKGPAASKAGWKLFQKVAVQAYVKRRIAERAERVQLSQDDVVQELRRIAFNHNTPESSRVRALEVIGKHLGMFNLTPPPPLLPVDPEVSELSRDEIDEELARIAGRLGGGGGSAPKGRKANKGQAAPAAGRSVRNLRPN